MDSRLVLLIQNIQVVKSLMCEVGYKWKMLNIKTSNDIQIVSTAVAVDHSYASLCRYTTQARNLFRSACFTNKDTNKNSLIFR